MILSHAKLNIKILSICDRSLMQTMIEYFSLYTNSFIKKGNKSKGNLFPLCVYGERGVNLAFPSIGYVSLSLCSVSMSVMNLVKPEPPATETDLVSSLSDVPINCIINESDFSYNFCN